jgi:glutamate formiminotransferase/glutamate formiminotransferase/formiminotetrahydrofolate cyclodeaminase
VSAESLLLAAPNVSEGRDQGVIAAIGGAFETGGARLLDVHVDPDHNRSVFTLAAGAGRSGAGPRRGRARDAVGRIDMNRHEGVHPCVGAVDVAPIVHLDAARRAPRARRPWSRPMSWRAR